VNSAKTAASRTYRGAPFRGERGRKDNTEPGHLPLRTDGAARSLTMIACTCTLLNLVQRQCANITFESAAACHRLAPSNSRYTIVAWSLDREAQVGCVRSVTVTESVPQSGDCGRKRVCVRC